jgi:hypothetical protein
MEGEGFKENNVLSVNTKELEIKAGHTFKLVLGLNPCQ